MSSRQNRYIATCFWLTLLLPVVGNAASSEEEVVNQIRKIYARTSQLVEKNKTEVITLHSEAGKDGYDIKTWRLVGDKQNYEKGAYEARIFIIDRNVVKTRVVVQSLSGDWANVIEYYYYPDGKRVRFLQKAYLKETGAAVPVTQIQDIDEKKYGAVCSLPFISLIEIRITACKK